VLLDWLIYGLLIWGVVFVLNATAFKKKPASRSIAWALTIVMFFVNLFALMVLQLVRHSLISQDLGLDIKLRSPVDFLGAFTASWFFFTLLRKSPKHEKSVSTAGTVGSPMVSSADIAANSHDIRTSNAAPISPQGESTVPIAGNQQAGVADEDRIYAKVANELEVGAANKGLWTRLFVECGGDENQTKLLYIKQRVDRLISAERLRLDQLSREQATQEALRAKEQKKRRTAELVRIGKEMRIAAEQKHEQQKFPLIFIIAAVVVSLILAFASR